MSISKSKSRSNPINHVVVIYLKEGVPAACPDPLCARQKDSITFSALHTNYKLGLPDIFTISKDEKPEVKQLVPLKLVVKPKAPHDVYHYSIEPNPSKSVHAADPTIIIHNGVGDVNVG